MMHFIAQFIDGKTFTGAHGYWNECPDTEITALHIELPFTIKSKNEDGTIRELPRSTTKISGYEKYYFANRDKSTIELNGLGQSIPGAPINMGACMAGLDYTHDFVLYIEVDMRGNVTMKRFTIEKFMKAFNIQESDLRKGAAE